MCMYSKCHLSIMHLYFIRQLLNVIYESDYLRLRYVLRFFRKHQTYKSLMKMKKSLHFSNIISTYFCCPIVIITLLTPFYTSQLFFFNIQVYKEKIKEFKHIKSRGFRSCHLEVVGIIWHLIILSFFCF